MKAQKNMPAAVRVAKLNKTVGSGEDAMGALRDVSFSVQPGDLLVVKSSPEPGAMALLNCVAGLEEPDSGRVFIGDLELTAMRESDRVALRQTHIGVLFRSVGLIPFLTVAENVEVPMRLVGMPPAERQARVDELLEWVGLPKHHHRRPAELSGGEQQHVGLARAFANRPKVLIVDEPTGQLNYAEAVRMVDLISGVVDSHPVAAIVSTNDPLLIQRADRVLELRGGRIQGESAGAASEATSLGKTPSGMIEVPAEIADQRCRKARP